MPKFWRSFEELAGDPAFEERLVREFPRLASVWEQSPTDRRRFLQLMAASVALAGAQGCSKAPSEKIMPYVRQPERITPGLPNYFATAMPASDGAIGLVATSNMGRPTKLEGNKLHAASLGATDAFAQASILTMYDPDRSQTVKHIGIIATWGEFVGAARGALPIGGDGTGLRILSPPVTSPTLARQREALLAALPQARWHQYEPVSRDNARQGAQLAFGADLSPIYDFTNADVVVAIDADFLSRGGASVRYSHDFMSRRGVESEKQYPGIETNRLYAIESTYTPTGGAADHRLPLSPSQSEQFLRALARQLEVAGAAPADLPSGVDAKWLDRRGRRSCKSKRGRSLVVVGDHLPASAHALGLRDQRRTRQRRPDGEVRRADRRWRGGFGRVDPRADRRPQRRPGATAGDPRREPGLRRAGRSQLRSSDSQNEACRSSEPLRRRNVRALPLAHSGGPLLGIVERRSRLRRHGVDRPAADRPALRRSHGARSRLRARRPDDPIELRPRPRHVASQPRRRIRTRLAQGPRRRRDRRHGVRAADAVDASRRRSANLPARRRRRGDSAFEMVLLPDPTIGDGRYANNGWLQEAPEAAHEAHLGQRRPHRPRRREGARRSKRATSSRSSRAAKR